MRADAEEVERLRGRASVPPGLIVRAAEHGHREAARLLAAHGADPSHRERTTALHEAAARGDVELARLLLALGADPGVRDTEFGATPAGWADHHGHVDLAALLRDGESWAGDA